LGIPYKVIGGPSFFSRKIVKDALAYLTCLINPRDTVAFARAIQSPPRGLGPAAIGRIEGLCDRDNISIVESCRQGVHLPRIPRKSQSELTRFADVVERYTKNAASQQDPLSVMSKNFLSDSGFYAYVKKESQGNDSSTSDIANLDELLSGIESYEKSQKNPTLSAYIQTMLLLASGEEKDQPDTVSLITMHRAKGLEWPCVHVIAAEEGMIPFYYAVNDGDAAIEEERRLFYVAMTRSQDWLFISYCKERMRFGKHQPCEPSRFLEETGVF
jgi:DNA helicase-2/ATP-dependent DNA helicase PcrA